MIKLPPLRKVIVESPFKSTFERTQEQHQLYLRRCLEDCYRRGESPFASHLYAPEVLNDDIPEERTLGIESAWVWAYDADAIAVYCDLGVTPGMQHSINHYIEHDIPIERRTIDWALVRAILEY